MKTQRHGQLLIFPSPVWYSIEYNTNIFYTFKSLKTPCLVGDLWGFCYEYVKKINIRNWNV